MLRAALACLCQAGLLIRHPAEDAGPIVASTGGPLVSVIIVAYNSRAWLADCLASLEEQNYPAREIILVDNHSSDDTVAWMIAHHPEIRLIQHTQAVSLAAAINSGVEAAQGEYFLLLNPDVTLQPDALSNLVQRAQSEPTVACVAAKLKLTWTPGFLNGIGNLVGAFGFGADIGLGHLDLGQFGHYTQLPSACFAAALVSRRACEEIGPLDPAFPLYYEDSEWCYRARLLGYSVLAAPQAVVLHAFGSRTPANQEAGISATRLERVVYGRLRFAEKLLSEPYRRKFMRRYRIEDSLRLLLAALRLRGSMVKAIWQGRQQFSQASDLPNQRAGLQNQRKISDEALLGLNIDRPAPLIWYGAPILTWDTIQSVYLPLILAGQTIKLPEFAEGYQPSAKVSNGLQRWIQILQLEGLGRLFHHLYRTIQWRLAQP